MPTRIASLFLLALLLTVVAGCDSQVVENPEGIFDAKVTGEFDQTLTGGALFATTLRDGTPVFTIQLQAENFSPFIIISIERPTTERFTVGQYAVLGTIDEAEEAGQAVAVTYTRFQELPASLFDPFTAFEGTLNITSSSSTVIEGSLAFSARGQNNRTLHFEGTFMAREGH